MLIAHARRIDNQLDRARGDMEALREGGSGRVIIGASGVAASDTVPLALIRVLERMPKARVSLVEGTTDRLTAQLEEGVLDLVLGRAEPEFVTPTLESELLFFDGIHFMVRPGHPLLNPSAFLGRSACLSLDCLAQGYTGAQGAGQCAGPGRPGA